MNDEDLFRHIEEQVANVVEHCWTPDALHCSGCEGSLQVILGAIRERLSNSVDLTVGSLAQIMLDTET